MIMRIIKAPFVWIFIAGAIGQLILAADHFRQHDIFHAIGTTITAIILLVAADAISKGPIVRSYITILVLGTVFILISLFAIMGGGSLFLYIPIGAVSIISAVDAARRWHRINYGKLPDPEKS